MHRRASLAALMLVLAGCVGPAGRRDVGGWLSARGADAMDVIGVRVGLGVGLGAWVRATQWAQLGLMWRGPSETSVIGASGTVHGEGFQVRGLPCLMFGTIGRYGGLWTESSREILLPGYTDREDVIPPIHREIIAGVVPLDGLADDWRLSLGAGVHVAVIGVEAELRPVQLFDFLAGLLLGYDPSGDDVPVLGAGESVPSRAPSS